MDQLTIVGTEDGKFVLASEAGDRFALPIDDILRSELRRADRAARRDDRPASSVRPREIQQHIRAGLSADEVAELLGARVEDVRRFEGPVIAEREHIVERALAVPVLMGVDLTGEHSPTFGAAIRQKLETLAATGERWTSWKEEDGWIVKLEFTASEVDHDARWSFEPRRGALAPSNADATRLSRQGPVAEGGLIPRLRALDSAGDQRPEEDAFDAEAFGPRALAETEQATDGMARSVREAATKHAPADGTPNPDTADLLEALRRRRGHREAPPTLEGDEHAPLDNPPLSLFDAPAPAEDEPVADDAPPASPADVEQSDPAAEQPDSRRRRSGRASMPSWDEIVFGARADD